MVALNDSLGALLIGVVVSAILYGFACIQTWYYYTNYPSDPWYIKSLVAAVLISETCNQALTTHSLYTYLITNFGAWAELGKVVWSQVVQIFFNAFTALLVQCFLAMRIYKLSNGSWLIAGFVMIFVIAEFFAAIIFVVKASGIPTFQGVSESLKGLSMAVNALAAAGDVVIAGSLCYLLRVSRTGFRRSDTLISKLVVFGINSGLLTSFCALASLVSISAWPHTWIYIAFYYCIDRLYWNSLLATLNMRKRLRKGSYNDDMSLSFHDNSAQQKTNLSRTGTSPMCMPNNISIKVDTTHEYARDERYFPSGVDVKSPEAI